MTPCPRCRAPVQAHARFCSECGTWVVHALPAPPPVAMPELAGTLPASAVMIAPPAREPEPAFDPEATSKDLPPAMSMGARPVGATMVRTLNTGLPPPPESLATAAPVERPSGRTTSRTIIDDAPPVVPSLSVGRTPRPLGAFLVSYQYEPLGTFWPLAIGPNLIGRAGGGRPDVDVGISDATVSTEHALVDVDGSGVSVEDRGSRNGTSVNGQAIGRGVRVPLAHGDRVLFGSFETILVQVPYPAGA